MGDAWEIGREGFLDAEAGEPLFPDAHPFYAYGWCIYHDCENPYTADGSGFETKGEADGQ